MKTKTIITACIIFCLALFGGFTQVSATSQPLSFSCSAQGYEAIGSEVIAAFTEKTGITVDLYVGSSDAVISRVENNYTDLAVSTTRLYRRHSDYGYNEIIFAKDPMVVFTNATNQLDTLTKAQVQQIFAGEANNWKQFGGEDQVIVTIVPDKHTGSYQNFKTLFMEGTDIAYDFMAYRSSMVVEAARRIPFVVSFVTKAAVTGDAAVKILKIDGIIPDSPEYPYYEVFSFVSKGEPAGARKAFVDFIMTGKGRNMLEKKGIVMLTDK